MICRKTVSIVPLPGYICCIIDLPCLSNQTIKNHIKSWTLNNVFSIHHLDESRKKTKYSLSKIKQHIVSKPVKKKKKRITWNIIKLHCINVTEKPRLFLLSVPSCVHGGELQRQRQSNTEGQQIVSPSDRVGAKYLMTSDMGNTN